MLTLQPESIISKPFEFPPKPKNPYTADLRILEKHAAENGLGLVLRMPDQVLVDIDSPELPVDFEQRLSMVNKAHAIKRYHIERSRSGNLHLTVTFTSDIYFPENALLFEAVLGGDFKRVMLGHEGYEAEGKFLSAFFRVPGAEVIYDGPYEPRTR